MQWEGNIKKSKKSRILLWLLQKLFISFNLGCLVTSVAPDNRKLICLLIHYLLLINWRNKNNAFFQAHKLPKLNFNIQNGKFFIDSVQNIHLPSTKRNQSQVQTLGPQLLNPCEKTEPMLLLDSKPSLM